MRRKKARSFHGVLASLRGQIRSGLQFVINIMTCLICITSHSTELHRMRFCDDVFDVSEVECVYCMSAFDSISFNRYFEVGKVASHIGNVVFDKLICRM